MANLQTLFRKLFTEQPSNNNQANNLDPSKGITTASDFENESFASTPQKITVKSIDDSVFKTDISLTGQILEASSINPKLFNPSWLKPDLDLEPRLPELKQRQITDASDDNSLAEVFEDGALQIQLDPDAYRHLTQISIGSLGRRSTQRMSQVDITVTATDMETGDVINLGAEAVDPINGTALVNLKDKLDAISTWSLRDQYAIHVETSIGSGRKKHVFESFEEPITLIKPMQWGSQHIGDEQAIDHETLVQPQGQDGSIEAEVAPISSTLRASAVAMLSHSTDALALIKLERPIWVVKPSTAEPCSTTSPSTTEMSCISRASNACASAIQPSI